MMTEFAMGAASRCAMLAAPLAPIGVPGPSHWRAWHASFLKRAAKLHAI